MMMKNVGELKVTKNTGLIVHDANFKPQLVYSDSDRLEIKFLKYMKYMVREDKLEEWFDRALEVKIGKFARMINELEWHETNKNTGSAVKGAQLDKKQVKRLLHLVVDDEGAVEEEMVREFARLEEYEIAELSSLRLQKRRQKQAVTR